MNILTISGSTRADSTTERFLQLVAHSFPAHRWDHSTSLRELPLFHPDSDQIPYPTSVMAWKEAVAAADLLIICTPAYLCNLPAALKSALEWLTTSGELHEKSVLALTFTPKAPRGEQAMQSLLWSLQALKARVLGQLALYQTDFPDFARATTLPDDIRDMLATVLAAEAA
ncbi:MAG: NADPH-dependent FMN reductase [Bacteroidota bacterium]